MDQHPPGWLGDVLQRIGYKGDAPSADIETALDAEDCKAVRRAFTKLGSVNLFTQEELACYKKLEADGKALKGDALQKAIDAKGLGADVREDADAAADESARQRRLLERWQRRCESLELREQQYARMAERAAQDAAELVARADATEADITNLYNEAVNALNSHEKQAIASANLMGSEAIDALPRRFLAFHEPETTELELKQLSALVAERTSGVVRELQEAEHSAFEVLYRELVRVHDAHVLSDFGQKVAESEHAAAQAELEFLTSVAERGNPAADRPPELLRDVLEEDQQTLDELRAEIHTLSRRLFNHLQAQPPERALPSITEAANLRATRLQRDVDVLEDVLFYQHQWYALHVVASAWAAREHAAVAALSQAVEQTDRALSQHIAAVDHFTHAQPAAGDAVCSFQDLVDAVDQTVAAAPRSLSEFVHDLIDRNTVLYDKVERLAGEESITTQVYVDAYRQLLEYLESRRDRGADLGGVGRKPETYCEADLTELKRKVDGASERLLDMIDAVEEAKTDARTDWGAHVDATSLSTNMGGGGYQYSNVPVQATPQDPTALPVTPGAHAHDTSVMSAKPTPQQDPTQRALPFATPGTADHSQPGMHVHDQRGYSAQVATDPMTTGDASYYSGYSTGGAHGHGDVYEHESPGAGPMPAPHASVPAPTAMDTSHVSQTSHVSYASSHGRVNVRVSHTQGGYDGGAPLHDGGGPPPPGSEASSASVKVPAFLLRADGSRMTPAEYREQNMRLLQSLKR